METVSEIFILLDRFLAESVTEGAARLADGIAGPVAAAASIYILMFGIAVTYGGVSMPIQEFFRRLLLIAFISALALEVGFYQREIVPSILAMPDGLAAAILPGNTGPVVNVVDSAMTTTAETVNLLWERAGAFSSEGLAYAAAAVLFLLAAVALLGVGACLMITAKAFLAFLLVLGPLAIACLMFERTSSIFDGWSRQLANYIILSALVSTIFGAVAGMYGAFAAAMVIGDADIGQSLIALLTGSVIGTMLMLQLPHLASGIAGGVAIQISRPLAQMIAGARGAFSVATWPVQSIGRHSYKSGANQNMPVQRNLYLGNTQRAALPAPTKALPAPALALPAPTGTGAAAKAASNGVRYQKGNSAGSPGKSPGVRWQAYKPKPSGGKTS